MLQFKVILNAYPADPRSSTLDRVSSTLGMVLDGKAALAAKGMSGGFIEALSNCDSVKVNFTLALALALVEPFSLLLSLNYLLRHYCGRLVWVGW